MSDQLNLRPPGARISLASACVHVYMSMRAHMSVHVYGLVITSDACLCMCTCSLLLNIFITLEVRVMRCDRLRNCLSDLGGWL